MRMLRDLVLISTKAPEDPNKKFDPIVTKESSNDSGTVVQFGEEVKGFKQGQRVYFLNDRKTVSIKNQTFLVMSADNIFAIEE